MAEIVLTCRVEIPGPTCHVYLRCALLFYFMYNMPEFSLYCEGCSRPLDLGANTFWEALQWEFEMMPINYSYPGIHQSCALNIFLSLKALVSTPLLHFSSATTTECERGGEKKSSMQVAHMHKLFWPVSYLPEKVSPLGIKMATPSSRFLPINRDISKWDRWRFAEIFKNLFE